MRERLEMKTHTLAVALSAGWPMALALVLLSAAMLMMFPFSQAWPMLLLLLSVVVLTFVWCLRLYLGTYLFLPATAYKGARIIARLGRNNEIEITGVLADEILIRQSYLEKRLGVCRIRQKGTVICLRGVREPEKVQAWVAENFPRERKTLPVRTGRKKK